MHESAIDTIIDRFDFKKVHEAMKAIDWRWAMYGVPSVEQLRSTATGLLTNAESRRYYDGDVDGGGDYSSSTGGLVATHNRNKHTLSLRFVLESVKADMETGKQTWK
jgi:hypothetical protein